MSKISDPAVPRSAALSPPGTLSTLPRELRDEIYSLVVAQDGTEYIFHSDMKRSANDQSRKKWTGDLAILESSTAIRQEALAILYAQDQFGFYEGRKCRTFQHERSDIPFVDHLSHIRFAFDVHVDDDDWCGRCHIPPEEHDKILSEKAAAPISFFTGTDKLRNSCVIGLGLCTPKLTLLLESPFFHAITRLTGFDTVTLVFHSAKGIWQEHVRYNHARIELFPDFATMVAAVSSALELTLGPSCSRKLCEPDPNAFGWMEELKWEVTFRPRDHLAAKYGEKESNSGTEGAALALSNLTFNDDLDG